MSNFLKYLYTAIILSLSLFVISSCSEEKEDFATDKISDYVSLSAGKSITYRIDSTVFVKNGTVVETHKYRVKHTVLYETNDNEGNKTYIIQRLINNENGTGAWVQNGNYSVTPLKNQLIITNDNLRVVALQMPLSQGLSWSGNSSLPFNPYGSIYDMDTDDLMNRWSFSYTNYGNETYEGQQYSNVWTIMQNNELSNIPPVPENSYGYKAVSVEKYAKNIGLVYKDYHIYEHQPGNAGSGNQPYYAGFGITMWMIEHN